MIYYKRNLDVEACQKKDKYIPPKIRAVSFVLENGFSESALELNAVSFMATTNSGESFWGGSGEEGAVAGVFDSVGFSW